MLVQGLASELIETPNIGLLGSTLLGMLTILVLLLPLLSSQIILTLPPMLSEVMCSVPQMYGFSFPQFVVWLNL